jgi:hypothetical protein
MHHCREDGSVRNLVHASKEDCGSLDELGEGWVWVPFYEDLATYVVANPSGILKNSAPRRVRGLCIIAYPDIPT